jgi:hypothetical protein
MNVPFELSKDNDLQHGIVQASSKLRVPLCMGTCVALQGSARSAVKQVAADRHKVLCIMAHNSEAAAWLYLCTLVMH